MQNTLKSTIPSFTYLLFGMLLFILISVINIPIVMDKYVFSVIIIAIFWSISLVFLRHEKTALSEVNLIPNSQTFSKGVLGFLIGVCIVGAMLLALYIFTDLSLVINSQQTWWSFLLASSVYIPMALMEELLFRGYPFFRLSKLINIRIVIAVTAILFALYHYNGTQDILTLLLGPGIWGVTFGVAAYVSNSIAVPVGLHFSANFLQAMFGLKTNIVPYWNTVEVHVSLMDNISPELLGIFMQIILLLGSVVVLEISIKRKKAQTNI